MKKFLLFEGRHEMPECEGAIFSAFDFDTFKGIKTRLFDKAIRELKAGKHIRLYVSGLTPALTEFLAEAKNYSQKKVIVQSGHDMNDTEENEVFYTSLLDLMHYNKESGKYVRQSF